MGASLPPALEPLAFLLGTWRGEGIGRYPTISDFTYREETRFEWPGKPVVAYEQRTWLLPDEPPSHSEVGYLRPTPDGAELVLAQPGGVVEVSHGTVTGVHVELVSLAVVTTPTMTKSITEVRRTYERRGDRLWYRLDMAAVGEPLGFHCEAELHPG